MPKMFNLENHKELMPYSYYNLKNINNVCKDNIFESIGNIKDSIKYLDGATYE